MWQCKKTAFAKLHQIFEVAFCTTSTGRVSFGGQKVFGTTRRLKRNLEVGQLKDKILNLNVISEIVGMPHFVREEKVGDTIPKIFCPIYKK